MNKILRGLLAMALAVSSAQLNAHTNKTFMTPRSHGVNLPMEYTAFCELISRKSEDSFGGNFQVTGFYQASTNGKDVAKYFLVNNKSTISFAGSPTNNNNPADTTAALGGKDLDAFYIIHNQNINPTDIGNTTLSLDPKQTAWGVRFDYHQDLDKILKGLYLHASLPIVHVENDPEIIVKSNGTVDAANLPGGAVNSLKTIFEQYFRGNFENTQASNLQSKLTHAKIAGKQSETGVADIDLALGYRFLDSCDYHAALALAITIPTGNEADGKYMFQPLVGNGKHFGLGGDFCFQACAWGDMDHNIKINLKAKYRYLFENSEKRTLGIKDKNWGQYYLLGTAGQSQLTPAANVTTLNVDVTPGSQFDGILGFAYNNCGFTLDVGYNMYFKEAESIKLKSDFKDGVYVVAARSFDTGTIIPTPLADSITLDGGTLAIAQVNKDTLDLKAAETPSQFTHSVYGSLGYIFSEWENPFMLAVGGKYEIPSKNSALEQWGVWVKAGIGF